MTQLSLLDKIKILLDTTKNSKMFIVIIIFLIFFAYILLSTNKKNKKTSKSIFILIYIFIFLFIIVTYHDTLPKMLDYLMNNLFIVIYFPNLAVYLAAIIITNVIIWISIFNFKTTKFIKTINITIYSILSYLLALLLNIISTEKLDVFTQQSVYGSKNALGIIELSSSIFVIWIIFLIVYKIFLYYTRKDYKSQKIIIERKVKKLPSTIIETKLPNKIKIVSPKNNFSTNISNYHKDTTEIEKTLTLEDYKLLLKMLKEKNTSKEEEKFLKDKLNSALKQQDYYVEPEIIETKTAKTKEIKEDSYKKEQSIFDELMNLYN